MSSVFDLQWLWLSPYVMRSIDFVAEVKGLLTCHQSTSMIDRILVMSLKLTKYVKTRHSNPL